MVLGLINQTPTSACHADDVFPKVLNGSEAERGATFDIGYSFFCPACPDYNLFPFPVSFSSVLTKFSLDIESRFVLISNNNFY